MIDPALKQALEPVPTVYPAENEFADPILYLSSAKIQLLGDKYGMIKVKPPASWKPPFSIDESSFKFKPRVQKLSELSLLSRIRTTFKDGLVNFMKMKKKKIPKTLYILLGNRERMYYYDLFLKLNHYISDNYDSIENDRKKNDSNGRNTVYNEVRNYPQIWKDLNKFYKLPPYSSEIADFYNNYMKEYCIFLAKKYKTKIASFSESDYQFNHNPYNEDEEDTEVDSTTNNSNKDDNDEDDTEYWCHICGVDSDDANTLLCDGCNKGYHTYCLTPKMKKVPSGSWYCDECLVGTGEYGFVTSNTAYSLQDFQMLNNDFKQKYFENILSKTQRDYLYHLSKDYMNDETKEQQYVDFLENEFWDNLVNNDQSNIKVNYGADIHNLKPGQISGFPMNYPFDENCKNDFYTNHSFNLTKLPFAKGSLLNHLNDRISGMTIPWLYIGSLFSTFCWHLEDHYMLSANYCHAGDIKKWYCIPESNCHQFEVLMKNLAPDLFIRQPDLLHQLVTLLSPFDILKNNIKCYYANQKPGEFIVTFPKCYHAGFNCGFNVNEAVNFTNNDWLKFGINALDDYKLVKKPPVFSQAQLCYSILYHMLNESKSDLKDVQEQNYKLITTNDNISESNYNSLILCIAYLEKILADFRNEFSKFQDLISRKHRRMSIEYYDDLRVAESSFNINTMQNLDKFYNDSADYLHGKSNKDNDDKQAQEIVCCECNEICYLSWVEVFTKKKIAVKKDEVKSLKEEKDTRLDLTPNQEEILQLNSAASQNDTKGEIKEVKEEDKETQTYLPTPEPSPEGKRRHSTRLAKSMNKRPKTSSNNCNNSPTNANAKEAVNMITVKEDVAHYCIEDFNKTFSETNLKRSQDFKVGVKLSDDKLKQIIQNSKQKLSTLSIL